MKTDPLQELLRSADAGWSTPDGSADLANRVRRRARRGRVARRVVTLGLVVVIGGASFWYMSLPIEIPQKTARVDIAALKREFARLNADAELHERAAERILARERWATRSSAPNVVAADDALRAQLERSALTLVNRGDHLLHDPTAKAEAVESFRRVLELFPQSRGAALARERLNEIGA